MATYSSSADHYAWGDGNSFPPWNAPEQPSFSLRSSDATPQAWGWFALAADVLTAANIVSATLTISGLASPSTGSSEVTVHGGESSDEHLPLDHDEAVGRTLTSASAAVSLNGLTTVDIDVATIIDELRSAALTNETIQIRLTHPTNDEAGLEGLTMSLEIEYTPGDVSFIEVDAAQAELIWSAAAVEYVIELAEAESVWSAAAVTATVPVIVPLAEAEAVWSAAAVTATVPVIVSLAEAEAVWSAGLLDHDVSIEQAALVWSADTVAATVPVIVSLAEAEAVWSAGTVTATVPVIVSLDQAEAAWSVAAVTATTSIVVSAAQASAVWSARNVTVGDPFLRAVRRGQRIAHCDRPFSSAPNTPGNTGTGGAALYVATAPAGTEPDLYYRRLATTLTGAVPAQSPHPDKTPAVELITSPADDFTPLELQPSTEYLVQVRTWRDDIENTAISGTQRFTTDSGADDAGVILGNGYVTRIEKRTGGAARIHFVWSDSTNGPLPTQFRLTRLSGPTSISNVTTTWHRGQRVYSIDVSGLQNAGTYTFRLDAVRGSSATALLADPDAAGTTITIVGDSAGPGTVSSLTATVR